MIVLSLLHKVHYLMTMMLLKHSGRNNSHSLRLVAGDQFKTYEELKTRLDYVLGNKKTATPEYEE